MAIPLKAAAQYIRMSTDRQDLSPFLQKDAIGSFAATHGLEIVQSYEDQGKSGVGITNRPGLRRLLADVAAGATFESVLVYDVSRWGRFQDADASAYYEYHCRLHGVSVIYVAESFANDLTPSTVLLKNMKRVMAAEYSRDLATKCRAGQHRVIALGFHMGALPPLAYRRCSVAADGSRRTMLAHGQLKIALTDRIEWVLAPDDEIALVRRICEAVIAGKLVEHIAELVRAEGWRTAKGRQVTTASINILVHHEALIGNFVWGVKPGGPRGILQSQPTRMNGSVPRIIGDASWTAMQEQLAKGPSFPAGTAKASAAAQAPTRMCPPGKQLALRLVRPPTERANTGLGSAADRRLHTRDFGRALRRELTESGVPASFDPRCNVLSFWRALVRIRLLWPTELGHWELNQIRLAVPVDTVLLVRMSALYQPMDFIAISPRLLATQSPALLHRELTGPIARLWLKTPAALMRHLRSIAQAPARRA